MCYKATITQKDKMQQLFCYNRLSLCHVLIAFTVMSVYLFVLFKLEPASSRTPINSDMKTKENVPDKFQDGIQYNNQLSGYGKFFTRQYAPSDEFVSNVKKMLKNASGNIRVTHDSKKDADQIGINGTKVDGMNDTRPDNCYRCFEHNFEFTIDNENICKPISTNQVIRLVIFITTIHKNYHKRDTIRQTWLTHTYNNTGAVRYAFLFGTVLDADLQKSLLKENDVHHDIIQEDFTDVYSNLTLKTLMAFKYATKRCAGVQYVMKTDDDMFLNIENLLIITKNYTNVLHKGIGGTCRMKAIPKRDKRSKWYASFKSYPNRYYPGFCSGTGYVTSLEVARRIYEISPNIPFFHLEDVYVAICIMKLGLRLTNIPGFNAEHPKLDPCNYQNNYLVTAHNLSPENLNYVWNTPCIRD